MFLKRLLTLPFQQAARFIFRYSYLVFAASIAVTVILGFFARQIKLDASLQSLLDEDHRVVQNLEEVNEIYGNSGNLIIVIRSEVYDEATVFIEKLAEKLKKHPEVKYVNYRQPVEFAEKYLLMFAETKDLQTVYNRLYRKFEYERKKNNPLLLDFEELRDPGLNFDDIFEKYEEKYNISGTSKDDRPSEFYHRKTITETGKEKHTFVVTLKPAGSSMNMAYSKKVTSEIETLIEQLNPTEYHESITTAFTGRYKKKPDSFERLGADFKLVTMVSGIGIVLILLLYFRSFWPMVLVFSTLITGVVWTVGMTQIIFTQLNLLTSFLVAILLGLGIDFGIHFLLRYKEERDSGKSIEDAFFIMFTQTGVASFASGFTTSVAFIGLAFSGFRAFSEFGVIAGTGVILILISFMTFFSSLVIIIDKLTGLKISDAKIHLKLPARIWAHPRYMFSGALIVLALAFFGMRQVEFDYDFSKVLGNKGIPSYDLDKEISQTFNRAFVTPSVILPRSLEEEKKMVELIEQKVKDGQKNPEQVRIERVLSLGTFIPENQQKKSVIIRRIHNLLLKNYKYKTALQKDKADQYDRFLKMTRVRSLGVEDLPETITRNFLGEGSHSDKRVVLIWLHADLEDGEQILATSDLLENIVVDGKKAKIASESLVFAEILRLIRNDGPYILLFSILAVYAIVTINFQSFRRGLFVLVPVSVAVIWLAGVMGLIDLKLDFINVVMFPIIVGIGIDSGVHIYHRYLESNDVILSVRNTGEAVALASLTTFVGFGALALAHNETISGMGKAAMIGISSSFVTAIFLLPSMILVYRRFQQERLAKKEKTTE